jgi:hypothetical protein
LTPTIDLLAIPVAELAAGKARVVEIVKARRFVVAEADISRRSQRSTRSESASNRGHKTTPNEHLALILRGARH